MRLDDEAGVLEKAAEIRLARREEQDPLLSIAVTAIDPHGGNFPVRGTLQPRRPG
jgi:hypothetical protein